METVPARLDIEVFVDCPYCETLINLLNPDDTNGYYHNDEGQVLSQACPDGHWSDEHKKFSVHNVECTSCKKSFDVAGLEW